MMGIKYFMTTGGLSLPTGHGTNLRVSNLKFCQNTRVYQPTGYSTFSYKQYKQLMAIVAGLNDQ